MNNLLSDHIFSTSLRYEAHRLIYTPAGDMPIELTGFLGAAVLAALLVDTDEGDARGIAIDTDEQWKAFFARYEHEVRRDDWGHLAAEIEQLDDAYIQIVTGKTKLNHICPNVRLLDLALRLMVDYMHHLVLEVCGEHIWEAVPWCNPFAQWLLEAVYKETERQRLLKTDWTDAAAVNALAEETPPDASDKPTFFFEGEQATDIMERYLQWRCDEYESEKRELPGAKITSADKNRLFKQETDWSFLADEIAQLDEPGRKTWQRWMTEWQKFFVEQLQPQKEIQFWAKDVPENIQEHLLYHLRQTEHHPAHFRELTTAVYAMRQLGYIRRQLSDKAIRLWLSERLSIDYTTRKNASQFQRAMKEHGRYTPEVRDEVMNLESMGFFRHQPTEE